MVPYPRTWADIDMQALARNLRRVRGAIGDAVEIALVAKADAYGHGLVPVCRWALRHEVSRLAVATVQEGIALRDAGVTAPVIVLSPTLQIEAQQAVFYDLSVTVEGLEATRALDEEAHRLDKIANIHLKVDTGLSRFGCKPDEAGEIAKSIQSLGNTNLEGVSQHFSHGVKNLDPTREQLAGFSAALSSIEAAGIDPGIVHSANGACAIRLPESRFGMIRLGLLAYGIDPQSVLPGLEPVMRWVARVTAVRDVAAGTGVSYEHRYVAPGDRRIATVGVGYGDGYLRTLSDRGFVVHEGSRLPVVGLVCMDQLLIDATDTGLQVGDPVELLGPEATALELAEKAGTTPHEITTRLMPRVPRRYLYD